LKARTKKTSAKKARGRPKADESDDVVAAVLRAVLDEIVSRGATGIRMDVVAKKARVNKTSIYRRWPTRDDLIVAALKAVRSSTGEKPFEESGDLREDLVALFERKARFTSTEQGRAVALALFTVATAPDGQELGKVLRVERTAAAQAIIAKAIARGELDKDTDAVFVSELIMAPIIYRVTHGEETFAKGEIAKIVDVVLEGIKR
jgi:AcrR family transcriptional regulator